MLQPKLKLDQADEKDIKEHLDNIRQISAQMNNLGIQRAKEVKALKRVWQAVSLQAKVDGKLPMELVIPEFVDERTMFLNVAITDGVASWELENPPPKKSKVEVKLAEAKQQPAVAEEE